MPIQNLKFLEINGRQQRAPSRLKGRFHPGGMRQQAWLGCLGGQGVRVTQRKPMWHDDVSMAWPWRAAGR
jgi:hypothetical protein